MTASWRAGLVAGAVALVVVTAGLAAHAWYDQQPPPLDESGPGSVVRLPSEPVAGAPPPRYGVHLADGSNVFVFMSGTATEQGRQVGLVTVAPERGPARQLSLGAGQSASAGGVTVTVLHVWLMPDSHHDAVDVRVVPSS